MPITRSKSIKMEETLKQLMEMMQDMKKSQEDMKTELKTEMKIGQEEMKKGQEDMRTELSEMKSGQEDMKKSQENMMTELKTEMKVNQCLLEERFQENMSELKQTMQSRFKDFEQTVEEEITQMKTDVQNKVQVIEEKVHTVEKTVTNLKNEVIKDVKRIESEAEDKHEELKMEIMRSLETKFASGALKIDGGITSSSRIQPPTFDGKVSWSTYLRQFEAAAVANNWSNEEKARSLILALRGEAVEVLRTISEDRQQDFTALSTALEMRYGELHLQHVYQAQLKGRRQRYDESLQQYEADIARMVNLAYPTAPLDFKEQLAVSSFIDGIRDSEISQALRLGRHKNIAEALAQALEIEAAKQASRGAAGRIRQVRAERQNQRTDDNAEDIIKIIRDLVMKQKSVMEGDRKRPLRCWNCGSEGHFKNRCPKNIGQNQDQGNAN